MTFIDANFSPGIDIDGQVGAVVTSPAAVSFGVAVQFDNGAGGIGVIAVPVSATGSFRVTAADMARSRARIVVAAVAMPPTPGTATLGLLQGGALVPIVTPGMAFPLHVSLANMPAVIF